MSESTLNIINKILGNYFDKIQIAEFQELLSKSLQAKNKFKSSAKSSNKEQLNSIIIREGSFLANVDLLITYANDKLSKQKFIELLLFLGESCISFGELYLACQIYNRILTTVGNEITFTNIAAHSLLALGEIYSRQAQWEESIKHVNKAKILFNKQKDLKGTAKCNNLLGTIYGDRGLVKKAKISFENSLTFLNPKSDIALVGMVETNLGILNTIHGEYDKALSFYQRALINYNQLKDLRRICQLRHNIGMLRTEKNEFDAALSEFDASIEIAIKAGYLPDLAVSYLSKAYIYTQLNDFPLATAFADKSLDISYKIKDRLSIADLYKIRGIIERKLKHYELAKSYFLTSIRINIELENILNQAESLFELGILYLEIGKIQEAKRKLKSALSNFKKIEAKQLVKKVNHLLSQIEKQ